MKLTLVDKKQEIEDVISFFWEPEIPLGWLAGQYMHWTLDHPNPDNRKTERYFTISSAPQEDRIMLTTRFSEKSSSFKNALRNLQLGGAIEADEPEGDFIVENPTQELVFIAGGIGITPYRSIIVDLDHRRLPINITLLYGNRDNNFVFKEKLEDIVSRRAGFKIHYFASPETIDEQTIKSTVPDLSKPIFYISGPEPMVEALDKMLARMGIPEERSKRDYFPGYDWP